MANGAGLTPFGASGQDEQNLGADLAALEAEVAGLRQAGAEPTPAGPDIAPLEARIAELEQALAAIPEAPTGDTEGLANLDARLAELETGLADQAPAEINPEFESRIAALETQIGSLANAGGEGTGPALADATAQINDLAGRLGALEERPAVDVAALETAIAELRQDVDANSAREQALTELQQQVAGLSEDVAAAPDEARVAAVEAAAAEASRQGAQIAAFGPAITADALESAVQSGAPFASELSALAAFNVEQQTVSTLQPYAEAGLPSIAELRAEFEAAAQMLAGPEPAPASAGMLDRLVQSARGLVEVRPSEPTAGADRTAILSRISGALEAGDLEAALTEWNTLPEDARTATADWAGRLQVRIAASDLVETLRSEALSRLGTSG